MSLAESAGEVEGMTELSMESRPRVYTAGSPETTTYPQHVGVWITEAPLSCVVDPEPRLREGAAERQPPPTAWRSFAAPRFERGKRRQGSRFGPPTLSIHARCALSTRPLLEASRFMRSAQSDAQDVTSSVRRPSHRA